MAREEGHQGGYKYPEDGNDAQECDVGGKGVEND